LTKHHYVKYHVNHETENERIKIESAWEKAISKALKKKRPSQGWPEEEKK